MSSTGGGEPGRVAVEVDALANRVRRLPPPSWWGPGAEAFAASLGRVSLLLDEAAGAAGRAGAAAARLGS